MSWRDRYRAPIPVTCDCERPRASHLGECKQCRRLIPALSYHHGARPVLPAAIDDTPWLPPHRRQWRP